MEKKIKMAVISGASEAIKFKDKNPDATNEEVMQHITDNSEKIAGNIDSFEEEI